MSSTGFSSSDGDEELLDPTVSTLPFPSRPTLPGSPTTSATSPSHEPIPSRLHGRSPVPPSPTPSGASERAWQDWKAPTKADEVAASHGESDYGGRRREPGEGARHGLKAIESWRIGESLGEGTSGRVRLARHMETQQFAAIKKVSRVPRDEENLGSIEREIALLKVVEHPHLLKLLDVFETGTHFYLVTEYCPRGELYHHLGRKGIPGSEAKRYFAQAAAATAHLHSLNIAHRDIKLENMLLFEDVETGQLGVKLSDFGMATFQSPSSLSATSCGSPHFAAPEVIAGKHYDAHAADIWSLGVVLFALLTMRLPFDRESIPQMLQEIKRGEFEIPEWLQGSGRELLEKLMVLDWRRRYTIDEVLQHRYLANEPAAQTQLDQAQSNRPRLNPRNALGLTLSAPDLDTDVLESLKPVLRERSMYEVAQSVLHEPTASHFYHSLKSFKSAELDGSFDVTSSPPLLRRASENLLASPGASRPSNRRSLSLPTRPPLPTFTSHTSGTHSHSASIETWRRSIVLPSSVPENPSLPGYVYSPEPPISSDSYNNLDASYDTHVDDTPLDSPSSASHHKAKGSQRSKKLSMMRLKSIFTRSSTHTASVDGDSHKQSRADTPATTPEVSRMPKIVVKRSYGSLKNAISSLRPPSRGIDDNASDSSFESAAPPARREKGPTLRQTAVRASISRRASEGTVLTRESNKENILPPRTLPMQRTSRTPPKRRPTPLSLVAGENGPVVTSLPYTGDIYITPRPFSPAPTDRLTPDTYHIRRVVPTSSHRPFDFESSSSAPPSTLVFPSGPRAAHSRRPSLVPLSSPTHPPPFGPLPATPIGQMMRPSGTQAPPPSASTPAVFPSRPRGRTHQPRSSVSQNLADVVKALQGENQRLRLASSGSGTRGDGVEAVRVVRKLQSENALLRAALKLKEEEVKGLMEARGRQRRSRSWEPLRERESDESGSTEEVMRFEQMRV